jgi:ribosome-binding ATPase YchF (GTP1/OBG family)
MEVGIVGLPGSGKTTMFQALTGVEPQLGTGKPNLGMAQIPDERLDQVARIEESAKVTPAALRVLDAAGTSAAQLGTLRRADALIAVVDSFSGGSDPAADLGSLHLELLVADQEHVERRLERVRKEAKSGEPALREEVDRLEAALDLLAEDRPLRELPGGVPEALDPLTSKPLIVVENGPSGIDAKLELELASMPADEAAEFRDGPPALTRVLLELFEQLDLISYFTAGDTEARAWTLERGQTALDAAEQIHTDIARGFVRCEVIPWDGFVESGSRAEAARRGLQRLEGKTYVVRDGDVLNIRFSPPR